MPMMLTRRAALLGLGAAVSLGRASLAYGAAPTENRFVVVLLRGAMDGLSAVQPYGDPAARDLRGELFLPEPGRDGGVLDLGGMFGLHPSLANLHGYYKANQAVILHAVAGHYRTRSHFEAQDYMEAGADQRLSSGWLNRAVAAMPTQPGRELALTLGLSAPLLLRGGAPVQAWAPDTFGQPSAELYGRLSTIMQHDTVLSPALAEGLRMRGVDAASPHAAPGDGKQVAEVMLAAAAGRLLAGAQGPRVAVLEIGGWDTHGAQLKRLGEQLTRLDRALGALHDNLGAAWDRTAVLVITEFGRTARINGTRGTDHGTGGAAFLVGGAVAGGRVRTDWPGLGAGKLLEDRDLQPTVDVRAICKGVLAQHLGLGAAALEQAFPGSGDAAPIQGLIRV